MYLKLTTAVVGVIAILIALDASLLENERVLGTEANPEPSQPPVIAEQNSSSSQETAEQNPPVVPPPTTTPSGPDVNAILRARKFGFGSASQEQGILQQIIPADVAEMQTFVLLRDSDRVGFMSWTESPEVRVYFLALKEALHSTFSPQMRDLIDELQQREGKPPRNFLTFLDPTINQERIVFVRVQDRLFEFHIAPGKDDIIYDLIEELTN